MNFLPIPAIDLMGGQVVRLSRGEASAKTVYSDDPPAMAREFEAAGATRLHIVDLDGAFGGESRNWETVKAIRQAVSMKIELGGGLRNQAAVERAFESGVDFAILGTSALRDRQLVEFLAAEHGSGIIVGIDARDGKVAIEGWVETSDKRAIDFARELEDIGVRTVIFTDIATDGMMTGPSIRSTAELADAVEEIDIIASGGIRNVMDLLALQSLARPNIIGAITGRAVYEKTLDIADAVKKLA